MTPGSANPPVEQQPIPLWTLLAGMASLLISYGLLMAGIGLFGTFIGLRAGLEGFSNDTIGFLVAAHYAGMILGTLRCGLLINRIGHIRAFAAFSSVIATATLVFPFATDPLLWLALRAIIGFNIAGVFTVAESWLNHKATPTSRGSLLSMYTMTSYFALGGGQALVNAGDLAGNELFMLASMLFGMAVVPVAITRASHPPAAKTPSFSPRVAYAASPVAAWASACSGLSLSALWGLGPIFAQDLGMSVVEVSMFMGLIILSAFLFQFPVGRLSDRMDRRKILLGVSATASAASLVMVVQLQVFSQQSPWGVAEFTTWMRHPGAIVTVAALYGGLISTAYPLAVAYANDYAAPEDMVAVSSGLLLAFGVGAALGAIPAGLLMQIVGPSGLFAYTASVALLLVVFIAYRMTRRSWVPVMEKEAFVALPEATSTPLPLEADPRAEISPGNSVRARWMNVFNPRNRWRRRENTNAPSQ